MKRLLDLEIDEVSLVDRPANQHGLVAITKRAEDPMPDDELYDADGQPVDEVEIGDVVYDSSGNEYEILDADEAAELEATEEHYDPDYDTAGELAGVGKAAGPRMLGRRRGLGERLGAAITGGASSIGEATREGGRQVRLGYAAGRRGNTMRIGVGRGGAAAVESGRSAYGAGRHVGRNRNAYLGGGAAAGVSGGAYGATRRRREEASKSLGDTVLEELSKALSDGDRDEVIAKAMDRVAMAEQSAQQAWEVAKSLEAEREFQGYLEAAANYDLPVHPEELADVLASASTVLSKRQLDTLDRVLSAQSEVFQELGYNGYQGGSEVMDTVNAYALEAVGKADMSQEQAVVALFESNPAAYDEYLAESR